MSNEEFRSGFVALIGKPNVGKSTLLNAIVGSKVAITSSKPQTTRRRVLGVRHGDNNQIVFVDTPGFYKAEHQLGQWMLDSAKTEGKEADLVVLVVDGTHAPTKEDIQVSEFLKEIKAPMLLAINKIDLVENKNILIPRIEAYTKLGNFCEIFPISAVSTENVNALVANLVSRLPVGCPYFPKDQVSDQNSQVLSEEIIREKVLKNSRQEVPHSVAVLVEEFRLGGQQAKGGKGKGKSGRGSQTQYIRAVIYVERDGQKAILLGKGGEKLKRIGQEAREELEEVLGTKVFLDLWVKVKEDWRERPDWLRALGYE